MKKVTMPSIFVVFVVLLLSSCTTLSYTSLDVLRPARVSFDPKATNILVVNNTVKQPIDYGHKTELFNETTKNLKIDTDSLALFCLGALIEDLSEKEFFDNVHLHLNSVNTETDFFTIKSIPQDSVKALCDRYNTDVVLSLDRFKVNDKITELYYGDTYTYYDALVARYESQWSIHYPDREKFETTIFRDTIYWDSESPQRKKAIAALPKRTDALIDGALYVGRNSIKRLIPYWDKADRYFFNANSGALKNGMDSVYVKNWTAAIDIWTKGLSKRNLSAKAKLANNIAVAYEITGDVEKAIEYAQKSVDMFKSDPLVNYEHYACVLNYLQQLNARKKEIELIDKQLGN